MQKSMGDKQEFLKELKELLKKYDVIIEADEDYAGDTHGRYGAHIYFSHEKTRASFGRVDGWSLAHSDIK